MSDVTEVEKHQFGQLLWESLGHRGPYLEAISRKEIERAKWHVGQMERAFELIYGHRP
jgi:hypothetical protein